MKANHRPGVRKVVVILIALLAIAALAGGLVNAGLARRAAGQSSATGKRPTLAMTDSSRALAGRPNAKHTVVASKRRAAPKRASYTYYSGQTREHAYVVAGELAVFFVPGAKFSPAQTAGLLRRIGSGAKVAAGSSEYVAFVQTKPAAARAALANAEQLAALPGVKEISPVFSGSPEGIAAAAQGAGKLALTGELIASFRPGTPRTDVARLAARRGLAIVQGFAFASNTYLLGNAKSKSRPALKSISVANELQRSGAAVWATPNWLRVRAKRAVPNDTYFPNQWHLANTGQVGGTPGEDINVEGAWDSYKGTTNEVVAIVDDGMEIGHQDLAANTALGDHWDWTDNNSDPTPAPADVDDNHGTACSGVAAGRGFNALGVSGSAPQARLIGHRMLGADTESNEASSLSRSNGVIDIYSNSWGPYDDRHLEAPPALVQTTLASGVANGRGGKGNIFVWAAGNGAGAGDDSNFDGYANSRYTIAVAASDNQGIRSYYSETGANLLVNAPSSGDTAGITTVDRTGSAGYNDGTSPNLPNANYTNDFGGTSSAAPLVSGVVALMLQANPELGWRDVQQIFAATAEKNDPTDTDWTTNGAGYHVNHKYGFGRVDASAAVSVASTWTPVGQEESASASASPNLPIPDDNTTGVSSTLNIAANLKIERVEVTFSAADHPYWNDLEVSLTSPSGTKSILGPAEFGGLLNPTPYDNWRFTTMRDLGESSNGAWKLTVKDLSALDTGTFQNWSIKVYGTAPSVWGTSSINNDAAYTATTTVSLDSTIGGATEMRVRNAGDAWPSTWDTYAKHVPWTLQAGDGVKTVEAEFRGTAGTLARSDTITLDTVAPTGTVSINSGASYATTRTVTLGLTSGDASQMMISNSASFSGASWEAFASSKPWTLASGEGTKTVYAKFRDAAGNASGAESDDIFMDTIAPTGSVIINSGTSYVGTRTVTISTTATDPAGSGIDAMRVSTDGVFDTEPWEPQADSKAVTLSSGDGTKTAWVQFRDVAGNVSSAYHDDIVYDSTPPAGSVTINGGSQYATSTAATLTLAASDVLSGVDVMRLSADGVFDTEPWEAFSTSKNWTLNAGEGEKTVTVQFRDRAGNVSTSVEDTIVLDTVAPTGTVSINSGASYATTRTVTLGLTSGDASQMMISNSASFSGASWEAFASSKPWTLASGEGTKTVYAKFRDAAGNASGAESDDIFMDTIAPTGSVIINSGTSYVGTRTVTISTTATDPAGSGIDAMRVSTDGVFDTEPWEPQADSKAVTLSSGDGTKTAWVQFRDVAGNVSSAYHDDIVYDSTPPAGSVTINGGSQYATSTAATLTLAASDVLSGVDVMRLSADGVFDTEPWEAFSTSKNWTLNAGEGEKTVTVQFRDRAGNVSTSVEDTIVLDTVAPTGTVSINSGASYATTRTVTLGLTSGDASQMMISNSASFSGASWEAFASSKPWTLASGEGTKTVYAKFRDAAGNASGAESDDIFMDTIAPTGSVIINSGTSYVGTRTVTISTTATDPAGSGIDAMRVSTDGVFDTEPWEPQADSKAVTLSSGDGTKTAWVQFRDVAGNVSSAYHDDIVYDSTPPAGSVTINGGSQYATSTAATLTLAASDVLSGVDVMRLSADGVFDTEPWEAFSTSKNWTLNAGEGEKTVTVQFRDRAGNVSTSVEDTITLDTVAPTGEFAINEGVSLTSTTTVSLDTTVTGADKMRFCNAGGVWSGWQDYSAHLTWTLSDPDGTKTVDGQFRDAAGNILSLSAQIALERGAPDAPGNFRALTGDASIDLSWVNPTGDFAYTRILRSIGAFPIDYTPGPGQDLVYQGTAESFVDSPLINGVTYGYTAFAQDLSGNWSVAATATAAPRAVTSLTLSAVPASSAYGTSVLLTGGLTSGGSNVESRSVDVSRSSDGLVWTADGTATWNSSLSRYEANRTITARTVFRFGFSGDTTYQPSFSPTSSVICKALLTKPWLAPATPRHRLRFTVYGYLAPRHAGRTKLSLYRRVRGAWVFYANRWATNYSYPTLTRYQYSMKIAYPGMWYVRAYHADADHLSTTSTVRVFTVR